MFSFVPSDLSRLGKDETDRELMRIAIMAEFDAINLYMQLAATTTDAKLKTVLLDVVKEEKTHVGEFQAMLAARDPEQVRENLHAEKEVKELGAK